MMKDFSPFKLKIHKQCLQLINQRIIETEESIKEIRMEAQLHARSSAGDLFEMGRAMADIEIEKYQKTLENLIQMLSVLQRIDPEVHQDQLALGTIVSTDRGLIYVAVGLGKTIVDQQEVLVISMGAPIVNALKNTPVGGIAVFNGNSYKINAIL
jgi:hypothetical protein